MQVMFNSQERTLREIVNLAASSGWKIIKVTKTAGSLFGYLVAVPVPVPILERDAQASLPLSELEAKEGYVAGVDVPERSIYDKRYRDDLEVGLDMERVSSRCGTPTFGSNTHLSSMEEALMRFGGGIMRPKSIARSFSVPSKPPAPTSLKPALSLAPSSALKKKRPSPLSVPPVQIQSSPSPVHSSPSWKPLSNSASPRRDLLPVLTATVSQSPPPQIIKRRMSLANLRPTHSQDEPLPPVPSLPSSTFRHPPPSPLSPLYPASPSGSRRPSHSQMQLSQVSTTNKQAQSSPPHCIAKTGLAASPIPSMIPVRAVAEPSSPSHNMLHPKSAAMIPLPRQEGSVISRRASNAHLSSQSMTAARKRSGTVIGHFGGKYGGESAGSKPTGPNISDGRFSGISGLTKSGTVLRFEDDRKGYVRGRAVSTTATQSPSPHSVVGSFSVLEAASRIDRGEFTQPPPSP